MERLRDRRTEPSSRALYAARVVHISVQPKTWFGKLMAAVVGTGVMLVAFFISIIVFAVIASLVVVAVIYLMWAARRARGAVESQIIDNNSCDPGRS